MIDSIALMSRAPEKPRTPEAEAFSAALRFSGLTKAAVAEMVGVTPGAVSQWALGRRPIPAERAVTLARAVGADPMAISASYRETVKSAGGALQVVGGSGNPSELDQLRDEVESLQLATILMAATMVRHRPAEALDAAAALRRNAPARHRDRGLLKELAELLERAGK